jgi:chromosomal replication initiation ATPase DnaA
MTLNLETESEVMEGVAFVARAPKLMEILDAVSAVYRIGKMDLMSLRRYKNTVTARHAFFWLARHLTPRTYVEIGRFMADRDHGSVWHGVAEMDRRLGQHKPKLRAICARLGVTCEELEA